MSQADKGESWLHTVLTTVASGKPPAGLSAIRYTLIAAPPAPSASLMTLVEIDENKERRGNEWQKSPCLSRAALKVVVEVPPQRQQGLGRVADVEGTMLCFEDVVRSGQVVQRH